MQGLPGFDAVTVRVLELWGTGLSAGLIADRLYVETNRRFSRSAVMGRLHRARLKLNELVPRRKSTRSPFERPRSVPHPNRKKAAAPVAPVAVQGYAKAPPSRGEAQLSAKLPFIELPLPSGSVVKWRRANGCAYLLGDDPAHPQWCNAPTLVGCSWCCAHFKLTHTAIRR